MASRSSASRNKSIKYVTAFVTTVGIGLFLFLKGGSNTSLSTKSDYPEDLEAAISERIYLLNRRVVSSSLPSQIDPAGVVNTADEQLPLPRKLPINLPDTHSQTSASKTLTQKSANGKSDIGSGRSRNQVGKKIESRKLAERGRKLKARGPRVTLKNHTSKSEAGVKGDLGSRNPTVVKEPPFTKEEVEGFRQFKLGPRIPSYDRARARYVAGNPGCNLNRYGKPKAMIVTATDKESCQNSLGDHLLLKLMKNKMDYARQKDMEIYWSQGILRPDFDIYWSKYPLLRALMLDHPQVEWFWWVDADAMITDMKFEIPWSEYNKNTTLVIGGWEVQVFEERAWYGINAGVFLIRNSQRGLDLLDEWASYGPKGRVRKYWGPIFTKKLIGRPDNFESDDQAAITWTMLNQQKKWGPFIKIENRYNLHTYWVKIVDKYEELMDNYEPGSGDDKWPFVTHFVGCKICAHGASYDFQNCSRGILRAYHFADNQIISSYGYMHDTLESRKMVPLKKSNKKKIPWKNLRLQHVTG